jgi:hypothetical protein
VRKIIHILVAVGLVLGLLVMAAPAAAAVKAVTVVKVDPECACCNATYNITFNISASLTQGVHQICIQFPEGTGVPAASTFKTGDIYVNDVAVFKGEVTVTPIAGNGTKVCFLVPISFEVGDNPIRVFFASGAGIVNPCTAGKKYLYVSTTRAPDSTLVKSKAYTIKPYYSTYDFTWDSSPTYPGLAEEFVPPFRECGQNESDNAVWNSTLNITLNAFNLTFAADEIGCFEPCTNVTLSVEVTAAPEDAVVHLSDNSSFIVALEEGDDYDLANITLATNTSLTYELWIHFDSVGEYELCFSAACEPPACAPPCCAAPEMPTKCYDIKVYQWKEAMKIELVHKWNLISLPLVPLEDPPIEDILKAMPDYDTLILSVWYYDRSNCASSKWLSYSPDGAMTSLTTMEDGKAYWIRTTYNSTPGFQMGDDLDEVLWVWGTPKPVPPNSPSAYPVCEGWDMIGYTEITYMLDDDYLWNFYAGAVALYGAVQGWNATAQTWDSSFMPGSVNMTPTKGYWASFGLDGAIYPP